MQRTSFLAVLLAVLLSAVGFASAPPPDFSGTWLGKTEVPDQGTDSVTLVLKKADDSYSGTLVDSLQMVNCEIQGAKVEADIITFHFSLTDGSVMGMKLKLTADTLAGEWQHPDGSTGPISFVRKK